MANPSYSQLITSTLHEQGSEISDNVTNNIPFYYWLKENGRYVSKDGGYEIREPLWYDDNGTVKWYSYYDQFDVTPQDVLTAAKYPWKQLGGSFTISGTEQLINSGKNEKISLVASGLDNLKKSLLNAMEAGLFSDGTADAGKQLDGMKAAIPTTTTAGTYGNISRSSFTFWQPLGRSSSSAGATRSAANIRSELDILLTPLARNKDKVDVGLMNDSDWNYLNQSFQPLQVMEGPKMAKGGFESIRYRGVEFVNCAGMGGSITSTYNYLINSDYFKLVYHRDCNMVPLEPEERSNTNQHATTRLIGWMGNIVCSGQKFHGILY